MMNVQKPSSLRLLSFAAMILVAAATLSAKPPAGKEKLAPPPKWTADDLITFFPDARTKLVGTRPDYSKTSNVASNKGNPENGPGGASSAGGWSKLIDAETIETEIKRTAPAVAKATSTPSEFKGGGYKECRRDFSVLAAMFAVSAEYDGDVRWHDAAAGLRDLFARAGHNCKAASDQTFQESKQRKQDLADLIGGTRPSAAKADAKADWPKVADRPPLMQRMNVAHEDRLKKWLANKGEFAAHHDEAKQEAQIAATIADIIGREGYEFANDEQYAKFARELREGASEVSAAVDAGNYEHARQGSGRMTKACADCHEGFRG
jgi:hypothetical protein